MVRISERRVRSRHLLDKGLEESERQGSVAGLKGAGGRSIAGDMGSAVKGLAQFLPSLGAPVSRSWLKGLKVHSLFGGK